MAVLSNFLRSEIAELLNCKSMILFDDSNNFFKLIPLCTVHINQFYDFLSILDSNVLSCMNMMLQLTLQFRIQQNDTDGQIDANFQTMTVGVRPLGEC